MKRHQRLIIVVITLVTLLTRFIGLDRIPPHLSNDEISIAYDAYSVSQTGRDEHNHFLPLSFQSHGTYKAPLAIYLTIPTTLLLGNNDWSVRLPSAILGGLTVLLLGLLIFELSGNYNLALIGSSILAITPWHIHSSRMMLESNVALFLVTLGVYLFYYGLNRKNPLATITSYFCLALSLYAYHTEWGFIPLLLGLLFIYNRRFLIKRKAFYLGMGLFFLLLISLGVDFVHNLDTGARANTETILSDPAVYKYLSNSSLNVFQKSQVITKVFLENYANYTNPSYLFFTGSNLLHPEDPFQVGLFLSPLLPCFLIGFFNLKKSFPKHSRFILAWAIVSPIVPALTRGGVNNVRNLVSVIPYTIIISSGCLILWNYLKKHRFLRTGALTIVLISFIYLLVIYYYHFPFESGENYQYGYKQIAFYIKPRYSQFTKIVIDPRFGDWNIYSGVPHLYIPYYTNLDPRQMLKRQESPGELFFDKYEFRQINWNLEKVRPAYLYVVPIYNSPPQNLPLTHLIQITLPDHKPAFNLYTLQKTL